MKLTKEKLKSFDPDIEVYQWYLEQNITDLFKITSKLIKEKHYDWCSWILVKMMDEKQCVKYALFAAERVLYIFEKKYPNDNRPRKVIEAVKEYLKNPNLINKDILIKVSDAVSNAYCDALNAYGVAFNAHCAADIITGNTTVNAYHAARAIYITYNVVRDVSATFNARATRAVIYAAFNATYDEKNHKSLKTEIVKYGIKLLKEGV